MNNDISILHECDLSYVWLTHNVENEKWILDVVKQTLIDQFNKYGSQIVTHLIKDWSIACLPITYLYLKIT